MFSGLIVAVLDKQRFQMKLLYKQKKKIDKQYQEAQEKNKHLLVCWISFFIYHQARLDNDLDQFIFCNLNTRNVILICF